MPLSKRVMQVLSQIHISVSSSGLCIVRLSVAYKSVRYVIVVGKCARPPTSSAQCISIHPFHSNFIDMDMVGLEPYVSLVEVHMYFSKSNKIGVESTYASFAQGRDPAILYPVRPLPPPPPFDFSHSFALWSVGRGRWIGDLLTFPALGASFPH